MEESMETNAIVDAEKIVGIIKNLYECYSEEKAANNDNDTNISNIFKEKIEKYLDLL